jgi:hypothetical protein
VQRRQQLLKLGLILSVISSVVMVMLALIGLLIYVFFSAAAAILKLLAMPLSGQEVLAVIKKRNLKSSLWIQTGCQRRAIAARRLSPVGTGDRLRRRTGPSLGRR